MRLDIHIWLHQDGESEILKGLQLMAGDLQQIRDAVNRSRTVQQSMRALLKGLSDKLRDRSDDPEAIRALAAEIDQDTDAMAADVTANTPADENNPMGTTPGGTEMEVGPPTVTEGPGGVGAAQQQRQARQAGQDRSQQAAGHTTDGPGAGVQSRAAQQTTVADAMRAGQQQAGQADKPLPHQVSRGGEGPDGNNPNAKQDNK